MPCKKKEKAEAEAASRLAVPEMSDGERREMEKMAIELVRALKYRDIESALEYFHPDERAKTEQLLRDDLDALTEALPDEEPEFRWGTTNHGNPSLTITNSDTEWGIPWFCSFQDGKWWFS